MSQSRLAGPSMSDAIEVLKAQSFSKLIGARLTSFVPGAATLLIPVADRLTQQNGFVHGGVLSYAADTAITFAGGSVLGPHVLTSGLTIDYVRPASGGLLVASARVVDTGERLALVHCEVHCEYDGEPVLCAVAQGTVRSTRSDDHSTRF